LAEETTQAKRFAQAVFEIAQERNEFEKWQSDLQKIVLLASEGEFVAVMENPRFSFTEKTRLLVSQLKDVNPKALNLAYILINQGKFSLISDINAEYQILWDKHKGMEKAEVITAVPLDDGEKKKLVSYLEKITGKRIEMNLKMDPDIIGGVIARVGGKIIDGSTKSQLNALKGELASAGKERT
jgi:F-type H+-transporting ATPase subunit delta